MTPIQKNALLNPIHHEKRRHGLFPGKKFLTPNRRGRLFVEPGPDGLFWHAEVQIPAHTARELNIAELKDAAFRILDGVGVQDFATGVCGVMWFHLRRPLSAEEYEELP